MTKRDLQVLDTYETKEYVKTKLGDDEIDIPFHMIPPNPEDSDSLPSNTHPSYPYGNPMSIRHPASRPRLGYDPWSRAADLHQELGYDGGGLNGALRWRELALHELLPVDELKEEAQKAMEARQMASGAGNNNPQTGQQQEALGQADRTIEEEDEEEEGDEEDEENDENELDEEEEDEEEDEEQETEEDEEDSEEE
ncbi:hypothetical protein K435DRAFT_642213 [Dendrothele bispora CBS 962.96]|uniref:Uncharacterized protein n=1 Tax=Dendrothele bispora (strain CBS 962.96) TaxID=1314807 RepID=A0A4S8MZH4_DENBC|nr:hypothetical protein K435DRAFT_642213 [Dendrothele bispora CBS 962.96]